VIFVDTWAWLALAHKRGPYHAPAAGQRRVLQLQKRRYVPVPTVGKPQGAPDAANLTEWGNKRTMIS